MATERELKIRKLFIKKAVLGTIWLGMITLLIQAIDFVARRYRIWLEAIWANGTDILGVCIITLMPSAILFIALTRCYRDAQNEVELQETKKRVEESDRRITMRIGRVSDDILIDDHFQDANGKWQHLAVCEEDNGDRVVYMNGILFGRKPFKVIYSE